MSTHTINVPDRTVPLGYEWRELWQVRQAIKNIQRIKNPAYRARFAAHERRLIAEYNDRIAQGEAPPAFGTPFQTETAPTPARGTAPTPAPRQHHPER